MMENTAGDIIFLRSFPGKMGISMAAMAKRACDYGGYKKEE